MKLMWVGGVGNIALQRCLSSADSIPTPTHAFAINQFKVLSRRKKNHNFWLKFKDDDDTDTEIQNSNQSLRRRNETKPFAPTRPMVKQWQTLSHASHFSSSFSSSSIENEKSTVELKPHLENGLHRFSCTENFTIGEKFPKRKCKYLTESKALKIFASLASLAKRMVLTLRECEREKR